MVQVSVDHPIEYRCNSAAPLMTRKHISKTVVQSIFEETVPISIYLLAINIHDMTEVKDESETGIPVTVLTPPHKKTGAKMTLTWAIKALNFFEKYLDTKYGFKKLDIMGIYDFNAGGMENIGMIHVMYDCGYPDKRYMLPYLLLYCRTVVVHEVSHMWFGNLVSVKWWDDLWLKEGFARFVTSYAMDRMKTDQRPGYHDFHLTSGSLVSGLDADMYKFTKPVRQVLKNSYGAAAMFNSLSYSKGAWVIRSVVYLIGDDHFQVGLRRYFTKFMFSSANFHDFVTCFGNITPHLPVADYMKNWLNQPGFPEIYSESFGNTLKIKQTRFTVSKNFKTNQTWYVPINYKVAESPATSYVLLKSRYKFLTYDWDRGYQVSNIFSPLTSFWKNWFILDTKYINFAVHRYHNDNYKRLAKALLKNPGILSDTQRLLHVINLQIMSNENRIDPINVLESSRYITEERNMDIAAKWLVLLLGLRNDIHDFTNRSMFNRYIKKLFIGHVKRVLTKSFRKITSWDDKSNYSWLLILGVKWNVPEAKKMLAKLYRDFKAGQHINANFLSYILRIYLHNDGNWIKIFKKLDSYPKSLQEMKKVLHALCRTNIEKHQKRLLKYSTTSVHIPRAQIKSVLCYIAYRNAPLAWAYFKTHYNYYFRMYGEAQFSMNRLLECLVSNLSTKREYDDVSNFFKTHSSGTGESGLKRGLKQVSLSFHRPKKSKKKDDDKIYIVITKPKFGETFSQWYETISGEKIKSTDDAYDSFESDNLFLRK